MRRGVRWLGLLVLICFVLPAVGSDDKKKDEKKPSPAEETQKDKKTATGEEKKNAQKKPVAKAKGEFKDRVVVLRMLDGRSGKVDDFQKLGIYLAYVKDNKIEYVDKEVELPRADELVVRFAYPPPFDDKGRTKQYSKKELDELRGPDKSLPGYPGDVDNLKSGQKIRVYLGKKKSAPKSDPAVVLVLINEAPP